MSDHALYPLLSWLTPTSFNKFITTLFEGQLQEAIDATILQIHMSAELFARPSQGNTVGHLWKHLMLLEFKKKGRWSELSGEFTESVSCRNDSVSRACRIVSFSYSAALLSRDHSLFLSV